MLHCSATGNTAFRIIVMITRKRDLSGFNNAAGNVCVVFLNEVIDATALSFDMSSKAAWWGESRLASTERSQWDKCECLSTERYRLRRFGCSTAVKSSVSDLHLRICDCARSEKGVKEAA